MTVQDSRVEYASRMHRVLAAIDQHLHEPVDLATLAGVAHFSPYHFHRLFVAWTGETLGDYVRRRRVEIAAVRLVAQPRVSILRIALSVGYGSAEAFARAFKLRFGSSPSAWRAREVNANNADRNPDQTNRNFGQAEDSRLLHHQTSAHTQWEDAMNVKLIEREPVTVAYLRHVGPYGEPLSRFWQDTFYPWAATHGLLGRPRYGISHDDPCVMAAEKCRYDACVEVPPDFAVSGQAFKATIAGGRYAALRFEGTVAQVGPAWSALLRDWLPASGMQLDARVFFEYYPKDAAFDPQTGIFACDICVPVMPL